MSLALALLGIQLPMLATASFAIGSDSGTPTDATVWCLDPAHSAHVAAAAASLGETRQHGQNVIVQGKIRTVEEWRDIAEENFDTACDKAFAVDGPQQPESDNAPENWEIAVVSALGGTALGALGAYASSAIRDRKLWARQDAAAIRRLAGEVRTGVEVLGASSDTDLAGIRAMAQIQAAVTDLQSILDEKELSDDDAARETQANLLAILKEIEDAEAQQRSPDRNTVLAKGKKATCLAREHAGSWAGVLNGTSKRKLSWAGKGENTPTTQDP